MPALLLSPLLWKVIAALAIAAALAYAWHTFVEKYREQGRVEVRAEWEADALRRVQALQETEAKLAAKSIEAGRAIGERDNERRKRAAEAQKHAQALAPAVAAVVVPAAAVGVLRDALAASDPAPATRSPGAAQGSAAAAAAGADSTVGLLTGWGVEVINLYDACRSQVTGWINFYASLQAAQPKEAP
jgi:hypothetical protein